MTVARRHGEDRLAAWVGGGVFLAVAGLAVALAAPTGHWLDSAEIAAASWELGIAHPPGHPLAMLLGKAFTLVPLGGIAFRVSCASAVALGVAAVVLLFTILRVARAAHALLNPEGRLPDTVLWPVAALGAAGFALGHAALYQGVRAEVYGLNLALNLGILHLALRYLLDGQRTADLCLAGLLAGFGLCNHHLLTLAVLPAGLLAVALAGPGWRRGLRQLGLATVAALLGLTLLLHLPVRSARAPLINWGAPHSLDRFAWTVSARLYARTAKRAVTKRPSHRAAALTRTLYDELGVGILLAALGGIVALSLRRRLAVLLAVLGLAAGANASAGLLSGFERFNPDSLGYVLLLLAVLSLLAAVGLILGVGLLGRRQPRRALVAVLAGGTVLWPVHSLAGSASRADLRQAYGAEVTTELLLEQTPPRALLLSSYYQTGFGLWAARLLDGARPDVDHVHRSYLSQPGYVANLVRRRPQLKALLRGTQRPGDLGYPRLRPHAERRAVLFEFDDDTYDAALIARSAPSGPLSVVLTPRTARGRDAAADLRRSRALWNLLEQRLRALPPDPSTRMYLLWASYLSARYHLRRGSCSAARPGYDRARKLGRADDPALLKIKRRCGF